MPFYSNEDEPTPCPPPRARTRRQNQRPSWITRTTSSRALGAALESAYDWPPATDTTPTASNPIYIDDDDGGHDDADFDDDGGDEGEIELTTVLPDISSFRQAGANARGKGARKSLWGAGGKGVVVAAGDEGGAAGGPRRKTMLNEPPRRPKRGATLGEAGGVPQVSGTGVGGGRSSGSGGAVVAAPAVPTGGTAKTTSDKARKKGSGSGVGANSLKIQQQQQQFLQQPQSPEAAVVIDLEREMERERDHHHHHHAENASEVDDDPSFIIPPPPGWEEPQAEVEMLVQGEEEPVDEEAQIVEVGERERNPRHHHQQQQQHHHHHKEPDFNYAEALQPRKQHATAASKLQPTAGAARRAGGGVGGGGAGATLMGRRVSAWVEAKLMEKQRLRAQERQEEAAKEKDRAEREELQALVAPPGVGGVGGAGAKRKARDHHEDDAVAPAAVLPPPPPPPQEEEIVGVDVAAQQQQQAKSYLNAPPKRGSRPAGGSGGGVAGQGGKPLGKENVANHSTNEPIASGSGGRTTAATATAAAAAATAAGNKKAHKPTKPTAARKPPPTIPDKPRPGAGENKRPAPSSGAADHKGVKKSKVNGELAELKRKMKKSLEAKGGDVSDIYYIPKPQAAAAQVAPGDTPPARFVTESDLEDDVSFGHDPLVRTSTGSAWDGGSPSGPAGGKGVLRLIKRRKVSQDADTSLEDASLDPAQLALAQQLAAKARKDGSLGVGKDKPVIPPPPLQLAAMNLQNPILTEDLARVEMYEDTWLSMMEASVTQLINAVYTSYEESQRSTIETHLELRREVLRMYSKQSALHKRIQASLSFGALSAPKDVLSKSSAVKSWAEDLGLRRKFVGLFMDTYEVEVLGIAMEVVVGRDLFGRYSSSKPAIVGVLSTASTSLGLNSSASSSSSLPAGASNNNSIAATPEEGKYVLSMNEKSKAKLVEGFLERFIVSCEDAYANPPPKPLPSTTRLIGALSRGAAMGRAAAVEEDWGSVAWGLRKTLLRALMLIWVLDKVKGGEQNLLGRRCLFKKTSQHKTSLSVLHALARMMLPSLGDVARPLSHMGYTLEHVQNPLEEYSYNIAHLAIDMRDGVRLIRLVELLLYSTEIQTAGNTDLWPLSKDIKFPAISRAHKLHNVNLALEALEEVGGNERGVRPEDIVDGYRERTVGLLWGIVGRWGLDMGIGGLVDWSELRKELWRLKKERVRREGGDVRALVYGEHDDEAEEENEEERGYVALLKAWARSIAAKYGLVVENLTTSFSDGRVFEAIVEEYEGFFPKRTLGPKGDGVGLRLEARLKDLGCSSYFAGLFGDKSKGGKVFKRDFVIAGLAFLCSRLLHWSIKERAAISIQTAFRAWQFAQTAHKRITLLVLAHECALYVQSRERVVEAVVKIQRAFREHIKRKLNRLLDAMTGIQALGRGLLVRKNLMRQRLAVGVIEEWWVGVKEARYRRKMAAIVGSLVPLQAHARGFLERKRIDDLHYAVAIVGVEWLRLTKGRRVREKYLRTREAAVTIQRWYRLAKADQSTAAGIVGLQAAIRGKLARDRVQRKTDAVVTLQRWVRSCKDISYARMMLTMTLWAAMVIQIRRRETVKARKVRENFINFKATVIAIQRVYRENRERRRLEELMAAEAAAAAAAVGGDGEVQAKIEVVDDKALVKSAVVVQSLWRGKMVRKATTARARLVCKRVLEAMAKKPSAGEETLGRKTENALSAIKSARTFGAGLAVLAITTRYSHECSAMLIRDDEVLKSLLTHLTSPTVATRTGNPSSSTTTTTTSSTTIPLIHRTPLTILNILHAASHSPPACHEIANRISPDAGRDIFSTLLIFLQGHVQKPGTEALTNAAVAVFERLARVPGVKVKLRARYKLLHGLGLLAKAERHRAGTGPGNGLPALKRAEKIEAVCKVLNSSR